MTDRDNLDETVGFLVETLTDGEGVVTYPRDEAQELMSDLDQSQSILACVRDDCDVGGTIQTVRSIPSSMPDCDGCGRLMHGATGVHRITDLEKFRDQYDND